MWVKDNIRQRLPCDNAQLYWACQLFEKENIDVVNN